MARTKEWRPTRVRSEDDRRGGGSSEYLTLDEGERFLGYALFEADPAVDEPGYYEYLEHFHVASRRSVPCAGENCPLCEDGDKPKTRAKTLWLVTRDEKGNESDGTLRIFNFNWNLIKYFTELRHDGDKIKGRAFRISKVDDRGNYAVMPKDDKLTATQVKEQLKSNDVPDLDALVTATLRRGMEGISVARALDDDDEPETNGDKPKAKKEPAKKKKQEGWPEEAEDLEVTVAEIDDENFILVDHEEYGDGEKVWGTKSLDLTDLEEGNTVTISYFTDDEDDKVATAFEVQETEEEEEASSSELPDEITGEEFEVVGKIDETDGTIPVKNDEYEFTLWILESMKVDWDDYPIGTKITVTAEKDSQGDMVATEIPEVVKAKGAKGGRKTAAKSGKGK